MYKNLQGRRLMPAHYYLRIFFVCILGIISPFNAYAVFVYSANLLNVNTGNGNGFITQQVTMFDSIGPNTVSGGYVSIYNTAGGPFPGVLDGPGSLTVTSTGFLDNQGYSDTNVWRFAGLLTISKGGQARFQVSNILNMQVNLSGTFTLNGNTLTYGGSQFTINTNDGQLENGKVINTGTFSYSNFTSATGLRVEFTNNGNFGASFPLNLSSLFTNNGTITSAGSGIIITNNSGNTFTHNSGSINANGSTSPFRNNGTFNITGNLGGTGYIENNSQTNITATATISPTFTNNSAGKVTYSGAGALTFSGTTSNSGVLSYNSGSSTLSSNFTNNSSGSVNVNAGASLRISPPYTQQRFRNTNFNIFAPPTYQLQSTTNISGATIAGELCLNGSGTLLTTTVNVQEYYSAIGIFQSAVTNTIMFSGNNATVSIGKTNTPSVSNAAASLSVTGAFGGATTINLVTSGSTLATTSFPITGVNTSLNLNSGTTATFTNSISGSGTTNNSGIINNNGTNAFALTGTLNNSGTFTVNSTLFRTNPVVNTGTFTVNNAYVQSGSTFAMAGGSIGGASTFGLQNSAQFNYTGGSLSLTGQFSVSSNSTINVNNATFTRPSNFSNSGITNLNGGSATISGTYHGSAGTAQLNIGQTTTSGVASAAAFYTTSGNITGPLAITVKGNGSQFVLNSPYSTSGTGLITIENGGRGFLQSGSTNAFPISNYGLLTVSSDSGVGTAINSSSGQITNQSTGAINIQSGRTLQNGALLTNNSYATNLGAVGLSIYGTLSGTGAISNSGSTWVYGNLQSTGGFANSGYLYFANGASNAITTQISNASGGYLHVGGVSHGSGIITNSEGGYINIASTFTLDAPGSITNNSSNALVITGTLNGSGSVSNSRYTFLSGNLGITGGFNNSGATSILDWRNGTSSLTSTITNAGQVVVTGASTLSATGIINNSKDVIVNSTYTLTNNGAINNITAGSSSDAQRSITVYGSINGTGTVTNNPSNGAATNTITYANASSVSGFAFTGLFTNSGIFNVNESLTRSSATTQTNANAVFNIADGKTFTNSSSAFNFTGLSGGTIQATGTGIFNNSGTVTVSTDVTNTSNFINSGTMTVDSTFTLTHNNYSGSQLRTLTNNSLLTVNGTITGTGAIVNNSATGSAFTINGSVNGSGGITNSSGAILNIANGLNNILRDTSNAGRIIITGNSRITGAITNNSLSANAQSLTINSGVTLTKNAGAITNNALNTMVITGTLTGTAPLSNAGTVSSTGTISSSGSITNTGTVTSSGSLAGAGDFTNATAGSILNINGGTYTRSGALSNAGTINLNAGTFTTPASFTNTGTTNLNGGAIGNNYIVTSGTNTLNVNTSYTMQGTFANVTNLNVTNINNVQPTLTAGFGVTGVSTYTISPGASAVHSAALSGASATTSSINNYNSMTFNTGASITNLGVINLYRGSAGLNIPFTTGNLTFNGSVTMSGTRIQSTEPTSTLTINSPATLTTNAAISGVGTTTINPGATLALESGGSITVTGYSSLLINGTLQILNGGTFTINPGDRISGAASGSIDTAGTFSLNGADLDFGGSFANRPTGIFTIYGTPTINFDGAFTNEGMIIATFNSSNGLPRINIGSGALNLSNGTLAIGYQNNYIAGGTYTFISAGSALTLSSIGGYVLPQPNTYIRSWDLIVEDNSIKIQVDRIGFGEVATTPETKQIGAFMDQLGANNPNASALAVLNALEQITDPLALDAALLEISPPSYVQLQSLNMLDDVYVVVQSRIGGTRIGRRAVLAYAAGDESRSSQLSNSVWLRPYGSSGRQHSEGNIIGYTARSNGMVFGADNQITANTLLGVAGSISKSTVTDEVNLTSITRIKSYQAMIYGWYKSPSDAYLDWVISGGANSYNGSRNMNFSTYNTTAESRYSGQQFSFKVMGSKSYVWKELYQLTPMASAQYSFVRQMPFTETGAGDFNRIVEPNNINLFQLGVGGEFSVPFDQKNMVTVPAVHAMVLVDAKGGALETNTQFISGGPILYNSVQAGRLAIKAGASLTFNVSDRVEVVANYDFEHRSGYFSNEVFVNLRYIF